MLHPQPTERPLSPPESPVRYPICDEPSCPRHSHTQCEDCGNWFCNSHHVRLADVLREHRKTDRLLCRGCADSYEQCPVCRFTVAPIDLRPTGEEGPDGYETYVCRDCKDAVEASREAAMQRAADREGRWYETVFAEAFPTIAELYEEAYGKAVR